MKLTEQQKKWNESIERAWKNRNKDEIVYNETLFSNPTIFNLYEKLKEKILQINQKNITIVEKSNYISFKVKKNNRNFVDVQLQKFAIKCLINIKFGKLKDLKKISRDVSKVGHFGSGDYEITINSVADIENSLDLIKQSYEINS